MIPRALPAIDPARLAWAAIAAGLAPDPLLTVSEWADAERVVAPESSPVPGPWRTELVPYLREIMDCLSPHHQAHEVTLMKSAQVAGTEAGINWFGMVASRAPAPMLIVLPTGDEVKKYVRVKLQPAIDATPALRRKVMDQKSRDETGSTTTFKRFPGGYASITGANSSAGLQMISVRYLVLEEISEYPFDVDGRGDPVELALARTKAFSETRKVFRVSTPGIAGMCRISAAYERSDKRVWLVPCPHCGHEQILQFENLRCVEDDPKTAYYACAGAGCVIEEHDKRAMVGRGRWQATEPGPGREPGFFINQLYSPFVPWAGTMAEWARAKGNPALEKVFTQQCLGEAYEAKGDAPDHIQIFQRREDYLIGSLPPGVLILTSGVDVQADRLEWSVWGWGSGKTSWLVDRGVIAGDSTEPKPWGELARVLARRYRGWQGREFEIECSAVDAGYNTQAVYAWTRSAGPRVIAIKGMAGHLAPPLGTPRRQEVSWQGKHLARGVLLWPVGTWSLKAEFYANLRKTISGPDADGNYAPGYVHLPAAVDEEFCRQLAAETLIAREKRGGLVVREWIKPRDVRNEALDMRVYAGAAAVHLGIDRLSGEDWRRLAAERGAPTEQSQRDLFALQLPAPNEAAVAVAESPAAVRDDANAGRHGGSGERWIENRARDWWH